MVAARGSYALCYVYKEIKRCATVFNIDEDGGRKKVVPNGVRFSAQILQLLALKCSKTQTLIQMCEVGAAA